MGGARRRPTAAEASRAAAVGGRGRLLVNLYPWTVTALVETRGCWWAGWTGVMCWHSSVFLLGFESIKGSTVNVRDSVDVGSTILSHAVNRYQGGAGVHKGCKKLVLPSRISYFLSWNLQGRDDHDSSESQRKARRSICYDLMKNSSSSSASSQRLNTGATTCLQLSHHLSRHQRRHSRNSRVSCV